MRGTAVSIYVSLIALVGNSAIAQDASVTNASGMESMESGNGRQHAVGTDIFMSTDADHTDVYRAGINLDGNYRGNDQYWGVRFEQAWYKPLAQKARKRERGFLRYADKSKDWAWNTQIGTDGHTVIGSASIHNDAPMRQEYFVERDIVETPLGVDQGIYYTFVGGAVDLPVNDRNNFTLVAGIQEFTGKNVRLHARGTYTHSIKPEWGLSFQLRSRYYHSTHPREYDYYSPRWYVQVLPVLQMRRYSGGWRYMVAGGFGGQRDANSDWQSSRFAAVEVSSPANHGWFVKAGAQYSNTPLPTGIYDYGQFSLALVKTF
ncbi:hypothetical protein [Rhizorhapis sp. SPR117]|uniref:hypothetical protein n=1 Tax=Rhizorhapis sp. SPR117 TaxID=2912611 RepID=UPI001F30FF54|nr:hypothetical protein [Rhizorhapis sp. SPR117]